MILHSAYQLSSGADSTYVDISGHWGQRSIEAVTSAGIMSGCDAERFCPDEVLTRAQAAAVLSQASGVRGSGQSSYSDVPPDHWAAPAISGLESRGHIGGCGGGQFCLESPVRRWIFIAWLVNVKEVPGERCF